MKFVAAKKEAEKTLTIRDLEIGKPFRFASDQDAGLFIRAAGGVFSINKSTQDTGWDLCHVIPAKVLLVEKGAAIEDIVKALEEL